MLHPLFIFSAVWLGVLFLYSLHLSFILRYATTEVLSIILTVWIPFAITIVIYTTIRKYLAINRPYRRKTLGLNYKLLRRRLNLWFRVWIGITTIEIIASKGVPIAWALTGSSKSYVDFGIKSLHGFVNSLQVAIAICYFVLFLASKQVKDLKVPIFFVCWCAVIINRNMMLVTLLEFAVLYVRVRGLKISTAFRLIAGMLSFILIFGFIGDIRQGSTNAIRQLAQPTDEYPEWLPSGALWAYIYITTPINNLVYNAQETRPTYNPLFPNTVATLFPSVIRTIIYGDRLSDVESGQLVVSAFNVSTAYVGPYQDFGLTGMTLFSVMIGATCFFFWVRNDLKNVLMLAVTTQCLILTLFFDHFFYLPVITQLGWIWYFFLPPLQFRLHGRRPVPGLVKLSH
jgi:oligosaccharide repeat unit polymerase